MRFTSKIVCIDLVAVVLIILANGFIGEVQAQEPTGAITGAVILQNGYGVPDATVRLYQNGQMYPVPNNPQLTITRPEYGQIGRYTFSELPYGQYTVIASKWDASGNIHNSSVNVTLNDGTVTKDIVIPHYPIGHVYTPPATPTPTVTPSPSPSPSPAGYEWFMLCGIAIGIAIVSLRKRVD